MRCAVCDYEISDPNTVACPNCGSSLPIDASLTSQESAPVSASEPLASAAATVPQSAPNPTAADAQRPRLSEMLAPLPPVRKRKFRVAGPIIAGVVVVAVVFGLLVTLTAQENNFNVNPTQPSGTISPTNTAAPGVAYQNSFANAANGWPSSQYCSYSTGGLHVSGGGCFAPAGRFQNVDVKVTVEQVSGPTASSYGVTVRGVDGENRYDVTINGDGEWGASRCDGLNSGGASCFTLVPLGENGAIHSGIGVKNVLEVSAVGTSFKVFANGVQIGSFTDTVYAEGYVGLLVDASDVGCEFTDLTIKRNS